MGNHIDIQDYVDDAYLQYSMYVILDRSLPHIGDGLKPVQRRLVYAMGQLGLDSTAKYKKSARTVGDVLGKYHPHGDTSCYEAMAMMAQPFSFRYPLVDGQGNWGSQDDPKSFAAMRYTEARLAKNSNLLLEEMRYKPVIERKNFDGTLTEPEVLPAQVPFLLLNGSSGIAVGMASGIAPHNMSEVIDGLIHLIDKPKCPLDEMLGFIQGPDFPTRAKIIASKKELLNVYEKGKGSIRMRCGYHIEKNHIIIDSLPYKISGEKVIEAIGKMVTVEKKLPVIEDIQDQSDKDNPTRIVIKLKKSATDQAEKVMASLMATTPLETNFKVNMNVIGLDGTPQVMGLLPILREWLDFRSATVRRRTENQLEKVRHQRHVTEGLLTAFLNLDEVIRIIREEDKPKETLIETFSLTDIQAEAILETRLRKLAKLEEMELKKRHKELSEQQARFEEILSSESNVRKLIRKELKTLKKDWSDERCSEIIAPSDLKLETNANEEVMIPSEPMRAMLSKNGYVRAAKGHTQDPRALNHKSGDDYLGHCDTKSTHDITLLDSHGRVYNLPVREMASARSYGDPVTRWLSPSSGSHWCSVFDPKSSQKWLVADQSGFGFIAPSEALATRNKKGKVLLSKTTEPLPVLAVDGFSHVAMMTSKARMLTIPCEQLPEMDKGKGVKLTALSDGEVILAATPINEGDDLTLSDRDSGEVIETLAYSRWSNSLGDRAKTPKGTKGLQQKLKKRLLMSPGKAD